MTAAGTFLLTGLGLIAAASAPPKAAAAPVVVVYKSPT